LQGLGRWGCAIRGRNAMIAGLPAWLDFAPYSQ
jgi:hypothetical protein